MHGIHRLAYKKKGLFSTNSKYPQVAGPDEHETALPWKYPTNFKNLANGITPVVAKVYNLTAFLFTPLSLQIKNSGNTMASKGINKVILVGNLGQAPEMQFIEWNAAIKWECHAI